MELEPLAGWAGQLALLGQVALAIVLGGLVGSEREAANRPAGLRTHMLLAAAAALLVGLGDFLAERFAAEQYGNLMRIDPIRLVEAVVTAVGFLGAGTIFRQRGDGVVVGLTTAASMLVVAAIGIAAGLRQYVLAVGVTLLTLLVLYVVRKFESSSQRGSGRD